VGATIASAKWMLLHKRLQAAMAISQSTGARSFSKHETFQDERTLRSLLQSWKQQPLSSGSF